MTHKVVPWNFIPAALAGSSSQPAQALQDEHSPQVWVSKKLKNWLSPKEMKF